ncbi:prephenate dehydrogenase [Streptomyces sp. NPDC059479]|uniref:prephenate dehydrogenase n=1 Tax=Streptomyces sp. NPDC059479 TaxID=3346848 RepID=UPI0036A85B6A
MAVVGTGLIGTSIGLSAVRHGLTVYLSDVNESAAQTASALGAGLLSTPAEPVDLAVLAVPPSRVPAVLIEKQLQGLANSYTDVASVKAWPERELSYSSADLSCYIGGHPLAGRERSGPLAARGNLFDGRAWVLTPSSETSQDTLNRTLELIAICGATPVLMGSEDHDRAVALTSHAPHAVASLMAARLQGSSRDAARLAGEGLRSVTRTAAGDPWLWSDIFHANAPAIATVLEELRGDLTDLLTALRGAGASDVDVERQSRTAIAELLGRGIDGLSEVQQGAHDIPVGRVRIRVDVDDTPGELARLLAALAEFGIGVEDIALENPAGSGLSVELRVSPAIVDQVSQKLAAHGWSAGPAYSVTMVALPTAGRL